MAWVNIMKRDGSAIFQKFPSTLDLDLERAMSISPSHDFPYHPGTYIPSSDLIPNGSFASWV